MAKDRRPSDPGSPEGGQPPAERPEDVRKLAAAAHRDIDEGLADFTDLLSREPGSDDVLRQEQAAAKDAHVKVDDVVAEPLTPDVTPLGTTPVVTGVEYLPAVEPLPHDVDQVQGLGTQGVGIDVAENVVEKTSIESAPVVTFATPEKVNPPLPEVTGVGIDVADSVVKKTPVQASVENKPYKRLEDDPRYVALERDLALNHFMASASDVAKRKFADNFNGQFSSDGYLLDKSGQPTRSLLSEMMRPQDVSKIQAEAKQKFISLYPDDYKERGEADKAPVPVEAPAEVTAENQKLYAKLEYDPRYIDLLEQQCLAYLTTKDPDKEAFLSKYSGQCNADGFLLDKKGLPTQVLPSQCISEQGLAEAEMAAQREFGKLYAREGDYTYRKTDKSPDLIDMPVIPEKVEKDLGYLDIDPKVIWEKLTPKDMKALEALMKAGDTTKISEFYQGKIKDVLVIIKKEAATNEDLLTKSAESINTIIQKTVELEAQRELLKIDTKNKGPMVRKLALNMAIMAGASFAISSLGIATGGAGILVGAAGVSAVRLGLRKFSEKQEGKKALKRHDDYEIDLAKQKAKVLNALFTRDNLEELRLQLSSHIANTLREQTSGQALKALREYEAVDGQEEQDVLDAKFRNVEKSLYLNALTRIRAEYPKVDPEQQRNMALAMALTLGQHERGENLARRKLEEIRKSKPALYKVIEKYNLLSAGKNPDKKPAGMTAEEESIWRKSKYELMSLAMGTAVGVAVRSHGVFRVAAGAMAGAGLGYKMGEAMERKADKKGLEEIRLMIDDAEKIIQDIEFPSDKIGILKENSVLVKSTLDLGLLDNDPLLRSRAENFIHQVQKIELANQKSLQEMLAKVSEQTDQRAKQVETDLNRIGAKIKNRRLWTTIGGAVAGGALAFAAGEIFDKKTTQNQTQSSGHENQASDTSGQEQPAVEQILQPARPLEYASNVEVHQDDTTWSLSKEQLQHRIGYDKWESYTVEQRNHMIDALKDRVTANPELHGIQNADNLQAGDRLDFSSDFKDPKFLDQLQDNAKNLSSSELHNIAANDAALQEAARHNIHVTTDNVDQVSAAIRQHGTDYLGHDGSVHDWTWHGQAVDRGPDGNFVVAETGQHLQAENLTDVVNQQAEKASDLVARETASQATAASQAAEQFGKQQVEQFLSSSDSQHYSHDVYMAAKASGQLEQVFTGALKNQVVLERVVRDWATDHDMSQNQQDIFLASLKDNGNIDLSLGGQLQIKGIDVLSQDYEAFKHSLLHSYDDMKHMDANQWHPVKVGDEYALVQKYHTSVWPIRKDHWSVDTNGDSEVDITVTDDAAMKAIFAKHSFNLRTESHVAPEAHQETGSTGTAPTAERAAVTFEDLNRNLFALDKFLDHNLQPEDRLAALAAEIPAGEKVEINGIILSGDQDRILWHIGDRPPIEINTENIDRVSKAIMIIQEKVATTPQKDWVAEIKAALREAKLEK